jgi:UDP-2,3-diacylglucosamine pyrophosphatase LpxH
MNDLSPKIKPIAGAKAAACTVDAQIGIPSWIDTPEPRSYRPKRKYRTVWISDTHLGTSGCNADMLLDFLKSIECEKLYLVGDIIDGWRLRKGWYWPQSHNEVIRRILKLARKGTQVIYVPGNHDEMFRDYTGLHFGGVELQYEVIHETADGRRLLVTHGDKFDAVVLYARWLAFVGDSAYTALLKANIVLNAIRRRIGLPYWSLSAHMKKRVKNAVAFIGRFEEAVAHEAETRGVDGVVCGHIHSAEIRQIGNVLYCNDGDWVESCTALIEQADGRLEIVDWVAVNREQHAQTREQEQEQAQAKSVAAETVGA